MDSGHGLWTWTWTLDMDLKQRDCNEAATIGWLDTLIILSTLDGIKPQTLESINIVNNKGCGYELSISFWHITRLLQSQCCTNEMNCFIAMGFYFGHNSGLGY